MKGYAVIESPTLPERGHTPLKRTGTQLGNSPGFSAPSELPEVARSAFT